MSNRYKGKSYYKKGSRSRGNSLHKGGMLAIDFDGFAEYAEKIDLLGGSLQEIFTEALEKVGETVQTDTVDALADAYLPAEGSYSKGDTMGSLVDPKVTVSGSIIEVPVGFDKTKKGAGGWLITGTPKMSPDRELAVIYDSKGYEKRLKNDVEKVFKSEVDRLMGG